MVQYDSFRKINSKIRGMSLKKNNLNTMMFNSFYRNGQSFWLRQR